VALAGNFSPRYERHRDDLVTIDVSGLGRLLGPARAIGEELRREAAARGLRVHVALASTRMAALVLVHARPGLTLVEPGEEAEALAPLPIGILEKIAESNNAEAVGPHGRQENVGGLLELRELSVFRSWGLKTLGELAALPPADLAARLGPTGLLWQAIARGDDVGPLVPDVPEERFESSIELEWPIDGLEPLSFVLTRLLEPLSTRLERRDRGAAVLHVRLGLVTHDTCTRSLQLPSPIRDVRTLRTLALLDLESHPPPAAIDRVTIVIDPTPGRVLQHTLFARAHPTPEQLSTLLARLGALMGQDRIGAPALVDSYRPGAFAMTPFATDHPSPERERHSLLRVGPHPHALAELRSPSRSSVGSRARVRGETPCGVDSINPNADMRVPQALRRCRHPVPARVAVVDGQPVRVTTDRRGFVDGPVLKRAGPWRTSGEWWQTGWNRDEWDVALSDGAVYRIFRDRKTDGWFIDAIAD
jgi:protein ImuB